MIIHEKKYKGLFISSIRTEHVREMTKKIMQKSGNAKIYVLTGCDGDKSENVHNPVSIDFRVFKWFEITDFPLTLQLISYFYSAISYLLVISNTIMWFPSFDLSAVIYLLVQCNFSSDLQFFEMIMTSNLQIWTQISSSVRLWAWSLYHSWYKVTQIRD